MRVDSERWNRLMDLFHQALESDSASREAVLREHCGDDHEMYQRVLAMVRSHEENQSFLDPPAVDLPTMSWELEESHEQDRLIGQTIGRYRIKRIIASGGMGTVYEAQQESPRRTVALKIMKQNVASKSAFRRFDYESQILARLRHPCIAQIYEAGTHDDGTSAVPYFAMEYIPNAKPVTHYVKDKQLTTRDRLKLLAQVCDAVDHGHQKGIIHRDLKPSNILVDSSGEPKVIDFGVARATDSDMVITSLQTDVGQLVGTLQYMSPEQCDADPHDLDTRSDVYALGVVLYEMLCEQLPYDVTKVALYEAARVIREQPPTRPSSFNKTLRGDVETIALKALEKDRSRRYHSAADFGADIRRYLYNEPIIARRASMMYHARTFARRNKALVGGVITTFVVLVAGLFGTTVGMVSAARAATEAQQQMRVTNRVNQFLNEDLLMQASPESHPDRHMTVKEVLDLASQRIDRLEDEPLIEAAVLESLGLAYTALGEYKHAQRHWTARLNIIQEHLKPDDPQLFSTRSNLAHVTCTLGDCEHALEIFADALAWQRNMLGDDHYDTVWTTLRMAYASLNLARYAEAEELFVRGLQSAERALGPDHSETLNALQQLGGIRVVQNRADEAAVLLTRAVDGWLRSEGEDHPSTLSAKHQIAQLYISQQHYNLADGILMQVIEARRRVLGQDHHLTAVALDTLALSYRRQGRLAEAESLMIESLDILRKGVGPEHSSTMQAMLNLALLYRDAGRWDEALPLYAEVAQVSERVFPDGHMFIGSYLNSWGECLLDAGRPHDAKSVLRRAHSIFANLLGDDHRLTQRVAANLAQLEE